MNPLPAIPRPPRTRRPHWNGPGRSRAGAISAIAFLAGLSCPLPAAARAPWRHGFSPYRAEFTLVSRPNGPKAGVAVYVPVCGLGLENGKDLVAYDGRNNQLALFSLGRSIGNTALALVQPTPATKHIYVYFGSKAPGPQAKNAFLPSLTLDVRSFPPGATFNSWKEVAKLLRASKRKAILFRDQINLSYNPADSDDAFVMVFNGYLRVRNPGRHTFMLVSDDAGYLFIDNKLLLQRNGRHWARTAQRGECRAAIMLKPGLHPIRCIVVDGGGEQMAVVARWISPKKKYILRPQDFLEAGKTRLVKVEARFPADPCPAFHYEAKSYMAYNGAQYTEVVLSTFNHRKAEWRFSDGARFRAAAVTRIFPGLYTRTVTVRAGRAKARGEITFPEIVPPRRFMHDPRDFDYYTRLIFRQDLDHLDVRTLLGYITFLDYHEMNEKAIPLFEKVIRKTKSRTPERLRALHGLARAAARNAPEKARKAYAELFHETRGTRRFPEAGREYVEFLLYRVRDAAAAKQVIEQMANSARVPAKTVEILRIQAAIQSGAVKQAKKALDTLLARAEFAQNQRFAVVKCNALRQRFYELLQRRFLLEAWDVLHQWEDLSAEDQTNGALSLARAKLFTAFGWYDGALAELDGAVLLNPLLPNLPDVELQRAAICRRAGDAKKARKILERIVKEYPNHPDAAKAKEWLQ